MKAKKKTVIALIVAAAAIIAAIAIWYFVRGRGMSPSADEAVYVLKVSDLTGQASSSVDRFSGVVESQQTIDYKKTGEAKIEEIYVTAGQTVDVDTPLFKYDVTEAQNNVDMGNLEIEGLNQKLAALPDYDAADADTKLEIIQFQTELKSKQVSIQSYQKQIDQAVVKSKVKGIVKTVNESGIDPNGSEAPIVSVTEIGEFRIKGKINEQQMSSITAGQSVIIRSRIDESKTWQGTVSKIDTEPAANSSDQYGMYGMSDAGSQASQYPFYISLENTEGLMLGQHVFIEPDFGQGGAKVKEGIWIDLSFVVSEDDGSTYVWASENGRLRKRSVEIGESDEDDMMVEIKDGLTADDYIAWPDDTLTEGTGTVSGTDTEVK